MRLGRSYCGKPQVLYTRGTSGLRDCSEHVAVGVNLERIKLERPTLECPGGIRLNLEGVVLECACLKCGNHITTNTSRQYCA